MLNLTSNKHRCPKHSSESKSYHTGTTPSLVGTRKSGFTLCDVENSQVPVRRNPRAEVSLYLKQATKRRVKKHKSNAD
jgi:hypothetical protein